MQNETNTIENIHRPKDLETRLCVIAEILARIGFTQTRSVIQAIAWWDECFLPTLCSDYTKEDLLEWKRTTNGPYSAEINNILDKWQKENLLYRPDTTPDFKKTLLAKKEILEKGKRVSGVEDYFNTAPVHYTLWYQIIYGFIDGFYSDGLDVARVSRMDEAKNIQQMILIDPVFTKDSWMEFKSPALVSKQFTKDTDGCDWLGNRAGLCFEHWKTIQGASYRANNNFQAAWLYARMLATSAKESFSDFGDSYFFKAYRKTEVLKTTDDQGITTAIFFQNDQAIAKSKYKLSKVQKEFVYPNGVKYTHHVDDGLLLDLQVNVGRRKEGIGSYVLKQAITDGCAHAVKTTLDGEKLLGWFGCKKEDNSWDFESVNWPICKPKIQTDNVVMFKPRSK